MHLLTIQSQNQTTTLLACDIMASNLWTTFKDYQNDPYT
jgi:hypothetical protein